MFRSKTREDYVRQNQLQFSKVQYNDKVGTKLDT